MGFRERFALAASAIAHLAAATVATALFVAPLLVVAAVAIAVFGAGGGGGSFATSPSGGAGSTALAMSNLANTPVGVGNYNRSNVVSPKSEGPDISSKYLQLPEYAIRTVFQASKLAIKAFTPDSFLAKGFLSDTQAEMPSRPKFK